MPTKIEKDTVTGTDTTGHEWDGIKELNTPLPKWWAYIFYATIAWSVVYWVLYPAWPSLSGYTRGTLGYSQRQVFEERQKAEADRRAPMLDKIRNTPLEQVRSDPQLVGFAVAGGRAAFLENCAPCHGAGGAGAKGYPNLVDDQWLWGGDLANIEKTIAYGVRNANEDSRQSQMPRFGADGALKPAEIGDVAEFVLSLSKRSRDEAAAQRGAKIYAEQCVTCHGENGEGNPELGAPSLAANIWLYGGDKASIVQTITFSRSGNMPAWTGRMDPATIKMLAVYVHSLGGGK